MYCLSNDLYHTQTHGQLGVHGAGEGQGRAGGGGGGAMGEGQEWAGAELK